MGFVKNLNGGVAMKYVFDWKEYAAVARKAAAEGCVLLRNAEKALPIKEGETVSVFGRSQFNYYKSGTGSGGMVNTPYVISILDALDGSPLKSRSFITARSRLSRISPSPQSPLR